MCVMYLFAQAIRCLKSSGNAWAYQHLAALWGTSTGDAERKMSMSG